MSDVTQLRSIRQLSEDLRPTGGFTEASLRWLVFNSRTNGLDQAIVRLGRKVYIDRERFGQWLEQHSGRRAA